MLRATITLCLIATVSPFLLPSPWPRCNSGLSSTPPPSSNPLSDPLSDSEILESLSIAAFRNRLEAATNPSSLSSFPSLSMPTTLPETTPTYLHATPLYSPSSNSKVPPPLTPGTVLLANPFSFIATPGSSPSPSLLSKYGLTAPLTPSLGPDRLADLLPALLILDATVFGTTAVLLNRRTGYLLGDLKGGAELAAFMIQPLWFGGTSGGSGMEMIHMSDSMPAVKGAKLITDDGVYAGGQPTEASKIVSNSSSLNGFAFKFFVQSTKYLPLVLESEIKGGNWFAAKVGKDVLFKGRDRAGKKRAKPLWTEIMELCGGDDAAFRQAKEQLYGEEGGSGDASYED